MLMCGGGWMSGAIRSSTRSFVGSVRVRWFRSAGEYETWSKRVQAARKAPEGVVECKGREVAPFLCDTNAFAEHRLKFGKIADAVPGTSSAATVQATWPLATDETVSRDVGDVQGWSAFRLGKFYEALDALTADSAYMHTDGHSRGLALVTAGHYFSRKLSRTTGSSDVTIRCYPTSAGSSSLEIRTDAVQLDEEGREKLVNSCHTVMVCVDKETLKPRKGAVPALVARDPLDPLQEERQDLAELHGLVRKRRAAESISLYSRKLSKPPDNEEMAEIHALHRRQVTTGEDAAPISEHTHDTTMIIFPESRNVHGKTFGGFVASQAFDLAYCAAAEYVRGRPFASLGIDEVAFLQPVGIGDTLNFRVRVVHAGTDGVFRVSVNVDVLDNARPKHSIPNRTNSLRFVFAANPDIVRPLLPVAYSEILGYVNASRRHAVEPIAQDTLKDLAEFLSARGGGYHANQ